MEGLLPLVVASETLSACVMDRRYGKQHAPKRQPAPTLHCTAQRSYVTLTTASSHDVARINQMNIEIEYCGH
jgi:hypothetical protein